MAEVRAPSGWYPDVHIPSILRWWDGQTWTGDMAPVGSPTASSAQMSTRTRRSPARVPELVPPPEHRSGDPGGHRDLDSEAAELFLAMAAEPGVMERDDLRAELRGLEDQVHSLGQERDDLLAAAVPLSAEVSDLRSKQEELISLRSEIQALRGRKSSLEKSVTGRRGPAEKFWSGGTGRQRFHDS